jgi:hypothetical protein
MATASITPETQGMKQFTARFVRGMAVGMIPGAIAGMIAGGVGSRLAMRVMAATSTAAVQGSETEFGATVGEISIGGTVFLLIAGAVLGSAGGLIFVGIRPLLPWSGRARGLAFGLLLLGIFGRLIIDPNNVDFVILDPASLAVSMFAVIFILYGVLLVSTVEHFEQSIRRAPPWLWMPLLGVTLLPLILTGVGGLALVVAFGIGFGVAAVGGWRAMSENATVMVAGRMFLALIFLLGAWAVITAAVEIV